ncbi:MAG: D-alanine--D-alanine ligase [Pseudomonadota bacterium]
MSMFRTIDRASDFGKVAVLLGGDSPERAVSLTSGEAVLAALEHRGVDVIAFDPKVDDLEDLPRHRVDRCFNILHGGKGEDGRTVAVLDHLGIPVTGSGVLGCALAMDKVRSKQVLAQNDIPVPTTMAASLEQPPAHSDFPVFVKPADGGSSIAARPVADRTAWAAAYQAAASAGNGVLVEPLLSGPEYTVGILAGDVLPEIRIDVASEFYDYEAKYESDATRFTCPGAANNQALAERLRQLAIASFSALDCRGWGRVDLMLGANGTPYVLEVNTVPGMTSHSLVPCAAKAAGIDFETLCWRILETSFSVGGSDGE